jgi:hypothetical protein
LKNLRKSIPFWIWVWYVLGNIADILSSLARWGGEELNPYFRDTQHHFLASHALIGKCLLSTALAVFCFFLYRLVSQVNKPLATVLSCLAPLFYGYMLWNTSCNNLFINLGWFTS